jgi:hypothetical protein
MNLSTHPAPATPSKAATFRKDIEFLRLPVDSVTSRSAKARKQDISTTANTTAQNPTIWGPLGYVQIVSSRRMRAAIKMAITVRRPPTHPTSTKAGNGSMVVDFAVPVLAAQG